MSKTAIISNSQFPELYEMSRAYYKEIPCEQLAVNGQGRFYSMKFLDHVITHPDFQHIDTMIYIDEDCFITDLNEMTETLSFFIDNNIDCMGMPDGGTVAIRSHNPVAINQFFCILNLASIRKKYKAGEVFATRHTPDLEQYTPRHLMRYRYQYDNFEPYYQLFLWMVKNGFKFHYLDASCCDIDQTTTILKSPNNKEFAYHTWYGRNWLEPDQQARIRKINKHCKNIRWKDQQH